MSGKRKAPKPIEPVDLILPGYLVTLEEDTEIIGRTKYSV